jgi:hypothetical protein
MELTMRRWLSSLLGALGLLTAAIQTCAQERAYSYNVVHPFYGIVGTFTERIARNDSITRIGSQLHIAVKILGIVVHREEGNHSEIFQGDRLVSLLSTTITNGARLDVRGDAQVDHFVVKSPTGVVEAPADVAPSDPWVLKDVGVGTTVSIKTGQIIRTRITEPAMISLQGVMVATRHFVARGERQQETWLNDHDVPIMFSSVEDGTPINFVLTSPLRDAAIAEAHLVPTAKLQPEGER